MICPKGSECTESTHEVKTIDTALQWFGGCRQEDLPVLITQTTAIDGRVKIQVTSKSGQVIHRRG